MSPQACRTAAFAETREHAHRRKYWKIGFGVTACCPVSFLPLHGALVVGAGEQAVAVAVCTRCACLFSQSWIRIRHPEQESAAAAECAPF